MTSNGVTAVTLRY